jgi:hypothetical protein
MDVYTWRQPWDKSLPLPFDANYQPKPAWTAIQQALHPPGPPPPPPPPPAPAAESAPPVQQAQAAASPRPPLTLTATLLRQRLRTLLSRRALTAQVSLTGSTSATVDFVARVRGGIVGRAKMELPAEHTRFFRIALTRQGKGRLRRARGASVVLSAIATDADARTATVISKARPG